MKKSSVYNNIIHAIEELYSSVSLQIVQKRMANYHSTTGSATAGGQGPEISISLFKYIDDVSHQAKKAGPVNQLPNGSVVSHASVPHLPSHIEISNKDIHSGLTRYFKERHSAELHPGIAENMEHSVWEHLHASIRHAKRGEGQIAKMHADLADNAFKELAHYISAEAHAELAKAIEQHLNGQLDSK